MPTFNMYQNPLGGAAVGNLANAVSAGGILSTANTAPYQLSDSAAQQLGPDAANAANNLYSNPNVDPRNASLAVNDLFGAAATGAQDAAQGQAQGIIAAGDEAEANAYLSAGAVADQNARLTRASAGIQGAQEDRAISKALGTQGADIAAAGFGGGTSAMMLFADSAHQGALAKQLIGTQGEINASGYEQQSLAAQAEAAAATSAAQAAGVLGAQSTQTAADLQTNALNSASFLAANATNTATHPVTGGALGGGGGMNVRVANDPNSADRIQARNNAVNAGYARYNAAVNNDINSPTYGEGPSTPVAGAGKQQGKAISPGTQDATSGLISPSGQYSSSSGGSSPAGSETPLAAGSETPLAVNDIETRL